MILDESIELKNKKQNIKEMNNLNNLPISEMRIAMQQMMEMPETSDCLYEVLVNEGFLPNELNEGSDYATELSTMMEDDDIMSEMYKSCTMNESECGGKMQEWLNEKLYGKQKQLDKNDNGKIDAEDFTMMRKDEGMDEINKDVLQRFTDQYGKKRGKEIYYATANKQDRSPETFEKTEGEIYEDSYPEGEHYKIKITQICDDLADAYKMMDDNGELPSWIQDKLAVMYHSADAIKSYLHGDTNNLNESDDDDEDVENPTYLISKKRVLDDEITKFIKYLEMFKPMLNKLNPENIKTYFQPQSEFSLEGFSEFLTKSENESGIDFYNRITKNGDLTYISIFDGLVNPRKRGFFVKYGREIGLEALEDMEELLSRIFDLSNSVYLKNRDIQKIDAKIKQRSEKETEMTGDYDNISPKLASKDELDVLSADALNLDMSYDDDEDLLEEADLPNFTPIKGKNVDSDNKKSSNDENSEMTSDVEDSQESTEEKVDNLKNQKYEKNEYEGKVDELLHGFNNNLDLDYNNQLADEQIDKIKDEVMGLAPKDHANVDHDSKGGEMLYGSAKKRAEEGITQNNYTSKPDRNTILPSQEYEKTPSLKESAEIERLKRLFKYTDTVVSENKKHTLDENKVLFEKISTKKLL
jgi:hypothetical protein